MDVITQAIKYVGFVILNLLKEAAAALTPSGRKAAVAALPLAKTPNWGGSGGNQTTTQLPITNWQDLKTSLPAALQTKIAQAERQRKRVSSARTAAPPPGSVQTAQSQAAADP